jgi:hypothetical protein
MKKELGAASCRTKKPRSASKTKGCQLDTDQCEKLPLATKYIIWLWSIRQRTKINVQASTKMLLKFFWFFFS